jgi:hypothetical protein
MSTRVLSLGEALIDVVIRPESNFDLLRKRVVLLDT